MTDATTEALPDRTALFDLPPIPPRRSEARQRLWRDGLRSLMTTTGVDARRGKAAIGKIIKTMCAGGAADDAVYQTSLRLIVEMANPDRAVTVADVLARAHDESRRGCGGLS